MHLLAWLPAHPLEQIASLYLPRGEALSIAATLLVFIGLEDKRLPRQSNVINNANKSVLQKD